MLSSIQSQAITSCLVALQDHARGDLQDTTGNLLAVLQEAPVPRRPAIRRLGFRLVPVAPQLWQHPDGPAAALRQALDDLRPGGLPGPTGETRFLAWAYRYTSTVDDEDGPVTMCQLDAVDIDDRAYLLAHELGDAGHCVAVLPDAAQLDTDGTLALLSTLAHTSS